MSKIDKSDEELMEAYKLGDSLAFEILFNRHSGRVAGFLNKRLKNSTDVQDVLQEVFFKLHRSKHLYNSTLPFLPWIFSITRSVLYDYLKKKRLRKVTGTQVVEQVAFQNEFYDSKKIDKEALEILPSVQRKAVGMRVYEEASFEEIASKLSTSSENARKLVSRGITNLRKVFRREKE